MRSTKQEPVSDTPVMISTVMVSTVTGKRDAKDIETTIRNKDSKQYVNKEDMTTLHKDTELYDTKEARDTAQRKNQTKAMPLGRRTSNWNRTPRLQNRTTSKRFSKSELESTRNRKDGRKTHISSLKEVGPNKDSRNRRRVDKRNQRRNQGRNQRWNRRNRQRQLEGTNVARRHVTEAWNKTVKTVNKTSHRRSAPTVPVASCRKRVQATRLSNRTWIQLTHKQGQRHLACLTVNRSAAECGVVRGRPVPDYYQSSQTHRWCRDHCNPTTRPP